MFAVISKLIVCVRRDCGTSYFTAIYSINLHPLSALPRSRLVATFQMYIAKYYRMGIANSGCISYMIYMTDVLYESFQRSFSSSRFSPSRKDSMLAMTGWISCTMCFERV